MELYASFNPTEQSGPIGQAIIKAAWCNNVGRYFQALRKHYGECVDQYRTVTRDGDSVTSGWVFERITPDARVRTTVRLFTPCPAEDPDAVEFRGTRFPFKDFILRQSRLTRRTELRHRYASCRRVGYKPQAA